MHPSARAFIAPAAGLASASAADSPHAAPRSHVDELLALSEVSNAALLRGDVDRYFELIGLTEDFTLMSPFGGTPSRGGADSPAQRESLRRFFEGGTLSVDPVASYAGSDLAVLALIERAHVAVGGLPAQDWTLRVTLVYRREHDRWRLAHRHADPLGLGITVPQAAALARGAAAS